MCFFFFFVFSPPIVPPHLLFSERGVLREYDKTRRKDHKKKGGFGQMNISFSALRTLQTFFEKKGEIDCADIDQMLCFIR